MGYTELDVSGIFKKNYIPPQKNHITNVKKAVGLKAICLDMLMEDTL